MPLQVSCCNSLPRHIGAAKIFSADWNHFLIITFCPCERASDPVRPSPFDSPHRVSARCPVVSSGAGCGPPKPALPFSGDAAEGRAMRFGDPINIITFNWLSPVPAIDRTQGRHSIEPVCHERAPVAALRDNVNQILAQQGPRSLGRCQPAALVVQLYD